MGLNRRFTDPRVIDNDAIVVLCFRNLGETMKDTMTHHEFKVRAAQMGFVLTKSDCHNMLHRATGRVITDGKVWQLTTAGDVYRTHVLNVIRGIIALRLDIAVTAQ